MAWLVTGRPLMLGLLAAPPLRATGLPKLLPSITNCTVPVGVPLPLCGVTVAVKLTLWPNTDGLCVELTTVVVATGGGLLTTWPPDSVPLLFIDRTSTRLNSSH